MNVPASPDPSWDYCESMLPRVSRTFALNIARLTGPLYRAVLIGYLLFRMADTLEDSPILTEAEKVSALEGFALLFRRDASAEAFATHARLLLQRMAGDTPEDNLLAHGARVFRCYAGLPRPYREIIGRALRESALGMAAYQRRKEAFPGTIFQLEDENDLTRYCYYVAGVVGKMLTDLFCQEEALAPLRARLTRQQIHFGIALQMTNIVKDYPRDLPRGWCYLPRTVTDRLGLTVTRLATDPLACRDAVSAAMIPRIIPHLDGAYRYVALLPLSQRSIRMFCIIPFVLAYHTLAHLRRTGNDKLSREQVRRLLQDSETYCLSDEVLRADYERTLRNAVSPGSW